MNNNPTLPISIYQKRFILEWLLSPNDDTYNTSMVFRLGSTLNRAAFKKAFGHFIENNEILHARFSKDGTECYYGNYDIDDFYEESILSQETTLASQLHELTYRSFDLTKDVLFKGHLLKSNREKEETHYYFIIVAHHAIVDGQTGVLIVEQLKKNYHLLVSGKALSEGQAFSFAEAVSAERNGLQVEQRKLSRDFWLDFIGDVALSVDLPILKQQVPDQKEGAAIYFELDADRTQQLKTYARTHRTTVFMVLSGVFGVLLSKYSNMPCLLISYPINMRPKGYEKVAGCFVNNALLKFDFGVLGTFQELLTSLRHQRKQTKPHLHYSFTEIVQDQRLYNGLEGNRFFNVGLNQTNLNQFPLSLSGVESKPVDIPYSTRSIYEMSLSYDEYSTNHTKFRLEYRKVLLEEGFAREFTTDFQRILFQVMDSKELPLNQISLLSPETYQQVVHDWNATDRPYGREQTVVSLFESQVLVSPDAVAVVFEGEEMTYAELNAESNCLARELRSRYALLEGSVLTANALVALCVDRSLEALIGIMGILKAGGAYVPIDPQHPLDRIDYILEDTGAAMVLTHVSLSKDKLSHLCAETLLPIDRTQSFYREQPSGNPDVSVAGEDLCYVIYTSGTTGRPKGVMVQHDSLSHLVDVQSTCFPLSIGQALAQYASLSFDASVWEIFHGLTSGAIVHVLSHRIRRDIQLLTDYIQNSDIALATLPPAVLKTLSPEDFKDTLPTLVVAGETSPLTLVQSWGQGRRLVNAYGPTEGTVCSTMHVYEQGDLHTNIGAPNANTKVYVLDADRQPVPVGVIGELYIGGAGIARGYLNREELTAERFLPNPFATERDITRCHARLYRTGDLVRWLPNGELEYIGRNDGQVKLRGYRIELSEVESALDALDGIAQSCVLMRERETEAGATHHLVGYYVAENRSIADPEGLRDVLFSRLPDYMVPDVLVELNAFPLTTNGKLDQRSLPAPDFAIDESYSAPNGAVEEALCAAWSVTLGLERVGVTDHFFRIGGTSLLAMQLAHRVSAEGGLSLEVSDIFRYPTVREQARLSLETAGAAEEIPRSPSVYRVLSHAQQRLWFIEQYSGGTHAYHIPLLLELLPDTEVHLLERALRSLVDRHEVLRSVMECSDTGEWRQVLRSAPLDILHRRGSSSSYREDLRQLMSVPFDLESEYPLRVCFYDVEAAEGDVIQRYVLLLFHHIACDGWSLEVLVRELAAYYEGGLGEGSLDELPSLPVQYCDYARWERNYLRGDLLSEKVEYWRNCLSGHETLSLPLDSIRPAAPSYVGEAHHFSIPRSLSDGLRRLSHEQGVTLYSILLSSVSVLLGKYSGQRDILTGSPYANRGHYQTSGLIGFFVNTLVNRVRLEGDRGFSHLVREVHADQLSSQSYRDLPFEHLLDHLSVERDPSRHPLFQVMFGMEHFGEKGLGPLSDYALPVALGDLWEVEKFDLSIFMDDNEPSIGVRLSYSPNLFRRETIERMGHHYLTLLEGLLCDVEAPYLSHPLVDEAGYRHLAHDLNATDVPTSSDTVVSLFEERVLTSPEAIALVFAGGEMTYKELNVQSNRLARELRVRCKVKMGHEMKADTLVALCLDRSREMIVSILGVLKAGGAYVPIDPDYPKERIDYILEDTKAELVLTQETLSNGVLSHVRETSKMLIDRDRPFYTTGESADLNIPIKGVDLGCVIYTSGTTGLPKGVMLEHKGLCNRILHMIGLSTITSSDCYLFKTNYIFDVSFSDIFTHLIAGATLQVTKKVFDLSEIETLLKSGKVTAVHLVTSQYDFLSSLLASSGLQKIYFSGEALTKEVFSSIPSNIKVYNYYGPTELGEITGCVVRPSMVSSIGAAFPNTRCYVLDIGGAPLPVGVMGELYIGGAGVARGYLNRKELTAERFLPNPFATERDRSLGYTRLYRTGDLVRWLPNGELEYIGRNDGQVKLRGHRIELGEVESVMDTLDGIAQSCVLLRKHSKGARTTDYLVGYYLAKSGSVPNPEALRLSLSSRLPDYMVPDVLVGLDSFPLTPNGKLDRRGLPEPDFDSKESYTPPKGALEKALCSVWCAVLKLEQVGATDHFFRIGGTSLLAMQLAHKVSAEEGLSLEVSDIFRWPTVREQASNLSLGSESTVEEISHVPSTERVLSHAQQRLWFIEQYSGGTHAYHIPLLLELLPATDIHTLECSLHALVDRHEVLRSVMERSETGEWQQVLRSAPVDILHRKSTVSHYEKDMRQWMGIPFNLESEYPLRVCFYEVEGPGGDVVHRYLLLLFHHIACDGWSMEVLGRELAASYKGILSEGPGYTLPPLAVQYSDYARWERHHLTGDLLSEKVGYWRDRLSGHEALSLPLDHARPSELGYTGEVYHFSIPRPLSERLRGLSREQGTTLYSVLLSSVSVLLGKYSGQRDILTGSPYANRGHHQTGDLIGFFVNTLVNRVQLDDRHDFAHLVREVHADQLSSQPYRDLPFGHLLDHLSVERDPSKHPLFQVMFGMEHFGEEELGPLSGYAVPVTLESFWEVEKFDLSIFMDDSHPSISVHLSYSPSLFRPETIERMGHHYLTLLEGLLGDVEAPYLSHPLLDEAEYRHLIHEINATDTLKTDDTIVSLFEERAQISPEATALVFAEKKMTYRELNAQSNRLAGELRARYKGKTGQELLPGTLIALCLDRSLEMIVGILGVLKARGAYVPIDPGYPKERIDYIMEDTKAELVLTQETIATGILAHWSETSKMSIDMDRPFYTTGEAAPIGLPVAASDLCYVIYTSGTTGRPKGVMVEQGSLANLIAHQLDVFDLHEERIVLFSNYVFDASLEQIGLALASGSTLFICKAETISDTSSFTRFLLDHRITHLDATPSYLNNLDFEPTYLKRIISGGEKFDAHLLDRYHGLVFNEYGPTECAVTSSQKIIGTPEEKMCIGSPISNVKYYVLDAGQQPVPIGVVGELYIGGACVARGYLNREELTAERFVANPFASEQDVARGYTRLYRTGDLVRWLSDGNLVYLGRNDGQVKVRGYRIELGEVDAALSGLKGIAQSCVLAKDRKTALGVVKYLVGYYVPEIGATIDTDSLRQSLVTLLPDYMVPSVFMELDSFPLTINGKLDTKALPIVDESKLSAERYVEARNETEKKLVKVWQQVLGIEQVGVKDNFFDLGGNSLALTKVSAKIKEQFSFEIRIVDLVQHVKIDSLAVFIEGMILGENNQGGEKKVVNVKQVLLKNRRNKKKKKVKR